MKKVLLVSTEVLWNTETQRPYSGVVDFLRDAKASGSLPVLLSSHSKPSWFDKHFDFMQFMQCGFKPPRQSGKVVLGLIEANKGRFAHSDFIVLGASDTDFLMAVNSQTFLIRADWVKKLGEKIGQYGVPIAKPESIPQVLGWLDDVAPWYFTFESEPFEVFALTNAGTINEPKHIGLLAQLLRACLKDGVRNYSTAFKLHLMASVYKTDIFREAAIWSYYPSSNSSNNGCEAMAEFSDLARITFKRRAFGPLFIRHRPSVKRHKVGGDRTDPRSQLETVHLNQAYRDKIEGRTVVVLDDYLTKGVSFGVCAALLRTAGAKKIVCVAMGKFGQGSKLYKIKIDSDPFKPVKKYEYIGAVGMNGTYSDQAKLSFLKKFRNL